MLFFLFLCFPVVSSSWGRYPASVVAAAVQCDATTTGTAARCDVTATGTAARCDVTATGTAARRHARARHPSTAYASTGGCAARNTYVVLCLI